MNISLAWLNTFLDRPVDADQAEHILTELGAPIDARTPLPDGDCLLDVEITSNRGDMLCHLGIARDLAAASGRSLRIPDCSLPESASAPSIQSLTSVENSVLDLCPLYTARLITGVKIAPSPDWLAQRIVAIGLRPVNNVVDITNFVMYELGQPLHAFDFNLLRGRRIIVRRAHEAEPFTAIDSSRHQLSESMLVIADSERPVALAGVMGGLDSEVSDQTTDILLEAAVFDPLTTRNTSRALKLASDSSYRFERSVDPHNVDRASRRAAQLILQLAGGSLAQGVLSVGSPLPEPRTITLRPDRCHTLLGYSVPADDMLRIFTALGFQPKTLDSAIHCTIPSHRLDVHREVDLIEEIARLHGFEHLHVADRMNPPFQPPQPSVAARRLINRVLNAHGYFETITFSTLSPAQAQPFAPAESLVQLPDDHKKADPILRPSILPSLLATRKTNQDAHSHPVKLYEVAQVFYKLPAGYGESRKLALLADAPDPHLALRQLRGTLDELFQHLGRSAAITFSADPNPPQWADTAALLTLTDYDQPIGRYALASPSLLKHFDLITPVVLAEIDYIPLITAFPHYSQIQPLPRVPAIERDLSIIIEESVPWASVDQSIRTANPRHLEHLRFVDVYRGKQIGSGRKSVTFRLTFRDPAATLTHEQVDPQVQTLVDQLRKDLQAELRVT